MESKTQLPHGYCSLTLNVLFIWMVRWGVRQEGMSVCSFVENE